MRKEDLYSIPQCITIFFVVHEANAIHKLVVVSPMAGSKMDFIRIRMSSPSTYVDHNERGQLQKLDFSIDPATPWDLRYPGEQDLTAEYDMRAKNQICAYIFETAFFDLRKENVVDLTLPCVREALFHDHGHVYQDIFGSRELYKNPYRRRRVRVGHEAVDEWTLRCLTHGREERKQLKEYFLSPLYNLSETGSTAVIRGRFVFERNPNSQKGSLSVLAVAEEPAVVSARVIENTHRVYFAARKETGFERPDPSTNVICGMSSAQKIRLCNLVFSSLAYRNEMKFLPHKDYIEPHCELMSTIGRIQINLFGIKNIFYRREILSTVDMMYDEYIIGCKAIDLRSGSLMPSVYVSRGHQAHTAIVYKRLQQNAYTSVVGLRNVSVITRTSKIRRVSPAYLFRVRPDPTASRNK